MIRRYNFAFASSAASVYSTWLRRTPILLQQQPFGARVGVAGAAGGGGGKDAGDKEKKQVHRLFSKFEEIDGATLGRIEEMRARDAENGGVNRSEWVALEKVHGSNFTVAIFPTEPPSERVMFFKRSDKISDSETMFGFRVLQSQFEQQIQVLHHKVQRYVAAVRLMRRANGGDDEIDGEEGNNSNNNDSTQQHPPIETFADALRIAETLPETELPQLHRVAMIGELFGGMLLHPDAPSNRHQTYTHKMQHGMTRMRGVETVQKDAFPQYSQQLHYMAFELQFQVKDGGPIQVVPFDDTQRMFSQTPGLFYAKPLLRGSLDKVVALDIENFTTTIPLLLGGGHENCYMRRNLSEGIVIRNVKRGLPEAAKGQNILKIKNVHFQELRHKEENPSAPKRKDPAADSRILAVKRVGPQIPCAEAVMPDELSINGANLLSDMAGSEVRLKNTMSKLGPDVLLSGQLSQARLAYLVAQDALKDFLKDAGLSLVNAPIIMRRELARFALFEAKKLVATQWEQLIQDAGAADAAGSKLYADEAAAAVSVAATSSSTTTPTETAAAADSAAVAGTTGDASNSHSDNAADDDGDEKKAVDAA